MKFCIFQDQYIQVRHFRVYNKSISCALSFVQLLITTAALCQHIYSLSVFKGEILRCGFNATKENKDYHAFLAADIIIFDIGLFHVLWGIDKCIANHLDGGYGRFAWCLGHTTVLVSFLVVSVVFKKPKPILLWPMLCQQSLYGIGLLILSLSALPKLLPTLLGRTAPGSERLLGPIFVYICGASLNFFLLYVFWHYYWFVEADFKAQQDDKSPHYGAGVINSVGTRCGRRFQRRQERFTFTVDSPEL